MKSIFLIENNTPVVAMVTMEKPKNDFFSKEQFHAFKMAKTRFKNELKTATRHKVIGKVPDDWVVGEVVQIEKVYQWLTSNKWMNCTEERYNEILNPIIVKRIVAKPLPVGEEKSIKQRMHDFFATESPEYFVSEFEKMGYKFVPSPPVKQETDEKMWMEVFTEAHKAKWIICFVKEVAEQFTITRK